MLVFSETTVRNTGSIRRFRRSRLVVNLVAKSIGTRQSGTSGQEGTYTCKFCHARAEQTLVFLSAEGVAAGSHYLDSNRIVVSSLVMTVKSQRTPGQRYR